ncbi:DUF6177 family protein [Streptomyces gamaensis]|uniref:DUF6177 family protein n=1 Tax=Streptomyces gamaensis TaxID=1763542 RepID=A0ABW0Z980_9ACTN
MTQSVIALTPEMPDPKTLLAGLYAGGPDIEVRSVSDGAVIQLCSPGGRPLLSVEVPTFVQVPGEARRLLGDDIDIPDGPLWWTQVHASAAVPEAAKLAGSFAGRLVTVLGGAVWPRRPVITDVVPFGEVPETAPDTGSPAVDVVTDKTVVAIQERPIIPLSNALAHALRTAATSGRTLQVITPPAARLTLPMRAALSGVPSRWVVRDEQGRCYDGLSGAELHWRGGTFAPSSSAPRIVEGISSGTDSGDRQLILSLRTKHPATEELMLGGALETAWRHLTGAAPAGWSTAEPVNLPWSKLQLTSLARSRAPQPTTLTVVGRPDHPALATLRVSRTTAGVEEDCTFALGYGPDEHPSLDAVPALAEELAARHGLISLLVSLRKARRDLTVPPTQEEPPIPVSFTLGADAVGSAPAGFHPTRLGAALHYPLGDGTDPAAWVALRRLTGAFRETHTQGTQGL